MRAVAAFLFAGLLPAAALAAGGKDNTAAAPETRGLVRSTARVELRTDLAAPLAEAKFLPGMSFEEGELLVAFDCRRQHAEASAADAARRSARVQADSKDRLASRGAAGRDEAQIARADAERAEAEHSAHLARLRGCRIEAPFAGRVVELNARALELAPADKPLIVILDDRRLELEMVAPSSWLSWLRVGAPIEFTADETGETHAARLSRIAAEVDPVSQTVRLIAEFRDAPGRLLPGMSGAARFPGGS
jgi:RND family efflux transporter MFP subunit